MMKKIDKLILRSFIGPFIVTFCVVVFILLMVYMLKYFDDFVGKDLGLEVFAELITYFSINMTPVAFPLAVLLASLMTFGNLGEHFELTAIKSAGISLIRAMRPLFFFVVMLSMFAYYSNNFIVPKANLNAYSLLYDIRQKKPSIDIKEGAFYGGIPGYSIKANKKYDDDISMGELIIYNHTKGRGNNEVILADSATMYTILGDQYLVMELFDGKSYSENKKKANARNDDPASFVRNEFQHNKIVFSLASFELERTDKDLFASNRLMKNEGELYHDVDSMREDIVSAKKNIYEYTPRFFNFHLLNNKETVKPKSVIEAEQKEAEELKRLEADSLAGDSLIAAKKKNKKVESNRIVEKTRPGQHVVDKDAIADKVGKPRELVKTEKIDLDAIKQYDSVALVTADSVYKERNKGAPRNIIDKPRFAKNRLRGENRRIENRDFEINVYSIEAKSKLSQAVACLVMFLIGAPLGAIIKKGGLGFPVLISIIFFIISYVINNTGIKMGRQGDISDWLAVWASNIILFPFGIFFLRQARNDSRLLESDNYSVLIDRIKNFFTKKKK